MRSLFYAIAIMWLTSLLSPIQLQSQWSDSLNTKICKPIWKYYHIDKNKKIFMLAPFANQTIDQKITVPPNGLQVFSRFDFEIMSKTMYSGRLHVGEKNRTQDIMHVQGAPFGSVTTGKMIPYYIYSAPFNDMRVPDKP